MCGYFQIALFIVYLKLSNSFEFQLGECPIVYNEICKAKYVKFILSVAEDQGNSLYYLDPYRPQLPRNFNVVRPLKIVIHGYGGLSVDTATSNVTSAYQTVENNVIIVDWGALGKLPCYATAYLNAWHVGQCVAILTVNLIPLGITPNFIHVVGFSLGAHIAGFAGANVNRLVGISYIRITGLDPALPFFATLRDDFKLDSSDAYFVDVVHTSAGIFGKLEAIGHVDFYLNGGSSQPMCQHAKFPPVCSHIAAGLYFSESIKNKTRFIGIECENVGNCIKGIFSYGKVAFMGEATHITTRGVYFVKTNSAPPFGYVPVYKGEKKFTKLTRIINYS